MTSSVILPYVVEAQYASTAGLAQQVLHPPVRVGCGEALVFPHADAAWFGGADIDYAFPPVTLTTYRDVVVRGRANTLTTRDAVVRHGLLDPALEMTPETFYQRLALSKHGSLAAWLPHDPFNVGYLPEAAVFTDGTSFNYAHWMTELLPRVAAFARSGRAGAVPLILDADLHPNILRSIAVVAGSDAVLHPLAPDELVRVGTLHNVSPTGYVPFNLRPQKVDTIGHGVFASGALRQTVADLRRAAQVDAAARRPKLMIRRNAPVRQIENEREIEAALAARGFEVIEPERLTLEQQIGVYSTARMIVGATGAAISNVIFCPPDCPVVVLMPRFRETAYWYWRRMAAAAGAGRVVHVSGPQSQSLDNPFAGKAVHQDFRVELRDVLDAVDAAEALSG